MLITQTARPLGPVAALCLADRKLTADEWALIEQAERLCAPDDVELIVATLNTDASLGETDRG